MEGATGLTRHEELIPGHPAWERARIEITRDVNAAIRGAVTGGASRILVRDSHAYGFNLLPDHLEPGVEYLGGHFAGPVPIFGDPRGFDITFYIGGHARPSTPDAFEPHTLRHRFQELRINGKPVCEVELFGALLGEHGLKMGLFTGEDVACDQAAESLPWILKVAVPKDPGIYEAYPGMMHGRIRDRIQRAATEAVERVSQMVPFTYAPPIRLEAVYADERTARRENRWDFPREENIVILEGSRYEDVFVELLKLGYFSPTTWRFRKSILTGIRWFQGLKSGCLP